MVNLRQLHALYYQTAGGDAEAVGQAALNDIQDWVLTTGCANHDTQNGLKWSLSWLVTDPADVVKRLHITIESLRTSYDLLEAHLVHFISKNLAIEEGPPEQPEAYSFWVALGVEADVAEELARLGLRWHQGKLQCHCLQAESDVVSTIYGLFLYVFRFKKFTDSRWVTVGDSCRSLVAALELGLALVVQLIRAIPETSELYPWVQQPERGRDEVCTRREYRL